MKLLPPLVLLFGFSATACGASSEEGTNQSAAGCEPSSTVACPCTDGTSGEQVCAADGASYSVCECASGAEPVNPEPVPVGTDPTGMDPTGMDPTGMDPTGMDPTGMDPTGMDPEALAYDQKYACNIDTGWAGDELCLAAPDPSEGFLLHYGPTDYDNPDDVASFVLQPGEEIDDERAMVTGNTTDILYKEYHIRLRPGTHHMIMWGDDTGAGGVAALAGRYMFGAQGALNGGHEDRPGDDVAPENEGVGYSLAAQTPVRFNMHYVNTTAEPMLREGWVNIHYADPEEVLELADPITFFGALGLAIPPQSQQTVGATCEAPAAPVRAIALSGHMHAAGQRFSAWHISGGNRNLVYETYNWSEPAAMLYDSVHENGTPDAATYTDGGHSGILNINPGDTIEYECEMNNTTDQTLRFGNQTYTAEMCLLFGSYAPSQGGPWGCMSF